MQFQTPTTTSHFSNNHHQFRYHTSLFYAAFRIWQKS